MQQTKCVPLQTLLQGKPYVPSHKTDIRETFKRVMAQTQKDYQCKLVN